MVSDQSYRHSFIFHIVLSIIPVDKPLLLLRNGGGNRKRADVYALPTAERDTVECAYCVIPTQRLEHEFRKCQNFMESVHMTR